MALTKWHPQLFLWKDAEASLRPLEVLRHADVFSWPDIDHEPLTPHTYLLACYLPRWSEFPSRCSHEVDGSDTQAGARRCCFVCFCTQRDVACPPLFLGHGAEGLQHSGRTGLSTVSHRAQCWLWKDVMKFQNVPTSLDQWLLQAISC